MTTVGLALDSKACVEDLQKEASGCCFYARYPHTTLLLELALDER